MHDDILTKYYLTTETALIVTIVTCGYGQSDEPIDRQIDRRTYLPIELLLQLEIEN